MTASSPRRRRLHEQLLLAAADVQGDTPIGAVPLHSENELDEFVQAGAIDRTAMIGAFTECERRGWMELIKVMGPWHWQVTYYGLEVADRMRAEDSATLVELEKKTIAEPALEPEPGRGWDVFLAHASEDKPTFADALAQALDEIGLVVWYDDFELVVGDSLRERIDDGLARSEFGIVLLSPHFFAKTWPQKELDGLAAKERNGTNVILPVWHQVDHDSVARYSPMLAGRMGVPSDEGAPAVAQKLKQAIHRNRMRRTGKEPA